jgi:plasmid stabilization system protein ParE
MASYRLSREAERDLHEIWDYISQDDQFAADRLLDSLRTIFLNLGEYPHMGQHREDFGNRSLRFFPRERYLIAYRPDTEPVEIYRVLSDYRNAAAILAD